MNDRLLLPTFFCPKPWEAMAGNETTRFCTYCQKHVHNLAALSPTERLALLSSPAGSLCARYQVAIRRPKPGKEESYAAHLLKYGVGVAAAGTVLLTLWEMHERNGRGTFHRVAHHTHYPGDACPMPDDYFEEYPAILLGDIATSPKVSPPTPDPLAPAAPNGTPPHLDVIIDPNALQYDPRPNLPSTIPK